MKAELTILEKSQQECIKIIRDSGVEDELWDGIIEHCCKAYSPRQLAEIYRQLCIQLSKLNKDDIPFCYLEMMEEFKEALKNLKVTV
jgi:hypothetical protein